MSPSGWRSTPWADFLPSFSPDASEARTLALGLVPESVRAVHSLVLRAHVRSDAVAQLKPKVLQQARLVHLRAAELLRYIHDATIDTRL